MFPMSAFGPMAARYGMAGLDPNEMSPGGAIPPFPASPASFPAGGQPVAPMGRPPVGMFAAGKADIGRTIGRQSNQMGATPGGPPVNMLPNNRPNAAPDGFAYGPSAGGDMPDVLKTGPLGPDQFALGRDMANLGHVDKIKRGGPNWQNIGQALSAGIAGYLAGRGNPAGLAMMQQNFLMQREAAEVRNREALEQMKAGLPQQVGDSLIVPDGMGGFRTVFRDAQPFEAYAESLGLVPGSPEYMQAVQDYRLGSWSDPALAAKTELEGVRYNNRDALQDQRLDVTRRGQDLSHTDRQASIAQSNTNNVRSTSTSRGNNIRSTNQSNTNSQRSADTARGAYSYTHGSGKGGKGSSGEGQIIVNPSTGQRMQLKGGQWVPIK